MAISELRRLLDQFTDRPDVIFDSAGHRWRFVLQRHMNSTEVVEREPHSQFTLMILPLLAEAVC